MIGRRLDVRKNTPYAYYENLGWDIVTETGGDSLARVEVKMREALVSISIVRLPAQRSVRLLESSRYRGLVQENYSTP